MPPELMLSTLVAYPTVVGTPNGALIDYLREFFAEHGIKSTIIIGPEGDRFNLFATIGPEDREGYVLSGHLDVVAANEPDWKADPFRLRRDGERLIGRGTTDMKGFVAAVLSAVPQLAKMQLTRPIHIALSYDEEAGCRGVQHLIDKLPTLCMHPLGCIVGEPTGLVPVLRHKGKAALRLRARGVSGHSSRPDLGENAIHALLPALSEAAAEADRQRRSGQQDQNFLPPYSTIQIGRVEGGQALNVIPYSATAEIEARAIADVDPLSLLDSIREVALADSALETEVIASYPPLSLEADAPLATLLKELSGKSPLNAVSFGTEAGVFQQAGIPSIVCGPGDIGRAHKPEEYITRCELHEAHQMVLHLGKHLSADADTEATGANRLLA